MAKVTNPLFSDFHEAFGDCIVFQRNAFGDSIARRKAVHALDPRSPHAPGRIVKWANAVQQHQDDQAANDQLETYVERFAIPPNNPTNLRCTAKQPHPTDPDLIEFTIAWDPPTHKYYGHALQNLAGYFIEITSDGVTWTRLNSEPLPNTHYSGNAPADTAQFIVFAVDDFGNVSTPSPAADLEVTLVTAKFDSGAFDQFLFADASVPLPPQRFNQTRFDASRFG